MDGFMPSMLSRWYFDLAMDPSFHFSLWSRHFPKKAIPIVAFPNGTIDSQRVQWLVWGGLSCAFLCLAIPGHMSQSQTMKLSSRDDSPLVARLGQPCLATETCCVERRRWGFKHGPLRVYRTSEQVLPLFFTDPWQRSSATRKNMIQGKIGKLCAHLLSFLLVHLGGLEATPCLFAIVNVVSKWVSWTWPRTPTHLQSWLSAPGTSPTFWRTAPMEFAKTIRRSISNFRAILEATPWMLLLPLFSLFSAAFHLWCEMVYHSHCVAEERALGQVKDEADSCSQNCWRSRVPIDPWHVVPGNGDFALTDPPKKWPR